MMKKMLVVLFAVLLCSVLPTTAMADTASHDTVYVTIADENGALALAMEPIAVSDADGDGAVTIHDALTLAHEANDKEYAAEQSEYGLSMVTLWGTTNGGSYGYYLNDASAWSLTDPVVDGDRVTAFVYTDQQAWSDAYSWFDTSAAEVTAGESITLTLNAYTGYDENWMPVSQPIADAVITVDGKETDFTTDADGKVTLTVDDSAVISAVSDTATLVPPVCRVTVPKATTDAPLTTTTTAADTENDDGGNMTLWIIFGVIGAVLVVVAAVAVIIARKKK